METKGLTAAMQPSVRWSRDSTALVHGKQHAGLAEGPRTFLQEEDVQVARKDPDSRGLVTPVPALLVPFEYFRLENHEGI